MILSTYTNIKEVKMANNNNFVQSVERALDILETLAENPKGYGVTQISKDLNLSKTTVHRLISTMKNKSFVSQPPNSDQYILGSKILYLSSCLTNSMDIVSISRPYIQEFVDKVDETVHLSVLDETYTNIVYIDKIKPVNPKKSVSMSSRIGKKVPLYCTASGKVILSQFDDNKIRDIMKDIEFIPYTPKTLTDIEGFIKEIHEVRKTGYALDNMEHEDGIRCISVPIFNRNKEIITAMSLSGLVIYNELETMLSLKEDLESIAKVISSLLGYKESN